MAPRVSGLCMCAASRGCAWKPRCTGGLERGMRSGTLPTHQIVGMGEAFRKPSREGPPNGRVSRECVLACGWLSNRSKMSTQRRLEHRVREPHVSFNYVEGDSLIMALKDWRSLPPTALPRPSEPLLLRALGWRWLDHSSNRFPSVASHRRRDRFAVQLIRSDRSFARDSPL
jgi:hypothetical protein